MHIVLFRIRFSCWICKSATFYVFCERREMPPVMRRGAERFDEKNPDTKETDKERTMYAKLQSFAYEVSIIGIRLALWMASNQINSANRLHTLFVHRQDTFIIGYFNVSVSSLSGGSLARRLTCPGSGFIAIRVTSGLHLCQVRFIFLHLFLNVVHYVRFS